MKNYCEFSKCREKVIYSDNIKLEKLMNNIDIKGIVENLLDTFLEAGKVSLQLREKV